MHHIILLFSIVLFSSEVFSKKLPAALHRCSKSSPEFKACLLKSLPQGMEFFADGYPELGIPRLEPFMVNSLDLGDSNAGSVKLHQIYKNMNLYGMARNGQMKNLEFEMSDKNCFWRFDGRSPEVRMEADYSITGQLLVFPINGQGRCNNSFLDMDVHHEMKCEKYQKKGKTHLRIISYTFDINPKHVTFYFENIIDGNEQLSTEVLKTMNENALSVFTDVREGFQKAFAQIWQNVGNAVFSKVPEEDLFLP